MNILDFRTPMKYGGKGGKLAEAVGFELTVPCGTPVFKTGAIDHSATPPGVEGGIISCSC